MTVLFIKILSALIFVLLPGYDLRESIKKYPILSPLSIVFGLILLYFSIQPLIYANKVDVRDTFKDISKNYIIKNKKVGIFEVDRYIPFPSSSDTYNIRKTKLTRTTEEGIEEENTYIVNEKGIDILSLKVADNSDIIYEIVVLSELAKTYDDIGINSTIETFIKTYKDYKIWYTYISNMYVIESKKLNAQFLLKNEDFIGVHNDTNEILKLQISDFKKGTKIFKIRLF